MPDSSERGFIRVGCTSCSNPDVWFTCNTCSKSDHFAKHEAHVSCDCGASYDHGTCTCGSSVPFTDLVFVDAASGPLALADLEVAWGRVAVLGVVVALVLGGVTYAVFT